MTERKQYTSVAELLADGLDESQLRDWVDFLWQDRQQQRQEIERLQSELADARQTYPVQEN